MVIDCKLHRSYFPLDTWRWAIREISAKEDRAVGINFKTNSRWMNLTSIFKNFRIGVFHFVSAHLPMEDNNKRLGVFLFCCIISNFLKRAVAYSVREWSSELPCLFISHSMLQHYRDSPWVACVSPCIRLDVDTILEAGKWDNVS